MAADWNEYCRHLTRYACTRRWTAEGLHWKRSGRKGRLTETETAERLAALMELPILTDAETDPGTAMALARNHRLSVCDATYLELALREAAGLASLDRAVAGAAAAEGIEVLAA